MGPRHLSLALMGLVSSWLLSTWALAAPPAGLVDLKRWEGRAALVPNPGPGTEFYRLTAVASWDKAAPRDPNFYHVRVTLPDGRVETQTLGGEQKPGSRFVYAYVPRDSVRNMRPEAVRVEVSVMDARTGAFASNALVATIADFPSPRFTPEDRRPYGWGTPLAPNEAGVVTLPSPSPEGLEFVRLPSGVFLSRNEVSNAQVKDKLGDAYDPRAGRSDNFATEADDQPALNLTPALALKYLETISDQGLKYRLPTKAEWLAGARGGRPDGFWWPGPEVPPGAANFLGVEVGLLEGDTTARVHSEPSAADFKLNPFGLAHVFGNVAEWATTDQADTFAKLGGHFRTDPQGANFLAEVFESTVTGADSLGDENEQGRYYVGLRPALELDANTGRALIQAALADVPELGGVAVDFDAAKMTARVSGNVPDNKARRLVDQRLRSVWFLAAVENQAQTPPPGAAPLATLGQVMGPAVRSAPLTRWTDFVRVAVRWSEDLPVSGSTWFTNVFLPRGGVVSHVLPEIKPTPDGRATIVVPLGEAWASGMTEGGPLIVALSLGAPATSQVDPRIVSNVQTIQWTTANLIP